MEPQEPTVPVAEPQVSSPQIAPSQVSSPQVPPPPPHKKSLFKNKYFWIVFIVFFLLAAVVVAGYFFVFKNINKSNVTNKDVGTSLKSPKGWINCDYFYQVIEDANSIYAGCLGGVLVVDKTTGEVKDQISMKDGLSNSIARSLLKVGDSLYIGGQNGITVFDLRTRQAKTISVKEGLVNGANISLALDGGDIWVGTFDGVSRLNIASGTLTNYKSELDQLATGVEIDNMLVTNKYVYFLELANVNSSGAVIRYSKSAGAFKTFKPDSFGVIGNYARIDFNTIGGFGGQIYVSDGKDMYSIDENSEDSWKKIESPYTFIKTDKNTDFVTVKILGNADSKGLLLSSENKIYRYISSTNTTEVVYDFGKDFADVLSNSTGQKIWFKPVIKNGWLSDFDLTTKIVTNHQLKDRPFNFGQILGLIDNELIFTSINGIYKYSLKENKFTPVLSSLGEYDESFQGMIFQPLSGTNNVFIMMQSCGQGCDKPKFYLNNYSDGTSSELVLPDEISLSATNSGGAVSYDSYRLLWRDKSGLISLGTQISDTERYVVYNTITGSWGQTTTVPSDADKFENNGSKCNKTYTYTTNGNKFSDDNCAGTTKNANFNWVITDGHIIETDLNMNKSKILSPNFLEEDYSPFSTTSNNPSIRNIIFASGKLWISSNRGLVSYNPEDSSYKVYGLSEGLMNKDVSDYVIGDQLWVITGWGGLSIINK